MADSSSLEGGLSKAIADSISRKKVLVSKALRAAEGASEDLAEARSKVIYQSLLVIFTAFLHQGLRTSWALQRQALSAAVSEAARLHAEAGAQRASPLAAFLLYEIDSPRISELLVTVHTTCDEAFNSVKVWDITDGSMPTIETAPLVRRLSFDTPSQVLCNHRVLHLGTANGRPLYLFPTFFWCNNDNGSPAVIELAKVKVRFDNCYYQENYDYPRDAEVTARHWSHTTKDGSRDLRFKDNSVIHIVRYGKVLISSSDGLDQAYMFSDAAAGQRFAMALTALIKSLRDLTTETRWLPVTTE